MRVARAVRERRMRRSARGRAAGRTGLLLALLVGIGSVAVQGTQVRIFATRGQSAFANGKLDGVSADSLGRLSLAPRVARVAAIEEPFLFSAAVLADGWVVGTGNSGKVLKIDRAGKVSELFAAPEPEVFAVWADPDGTVFAGTSPRGKVYRISPASAKGKEGKAEVFFDPQQIYIWSLARAADGSLLIATGTDGKLFRVDAAGKSSLLFDSDDAHIRTIEALPNGDVLAGTAGDGLVLRIAPDGKARTLYDADQPEVVALAVGPDGTCYAALVASEASLVDQARDQAAAAPGGKPAGGPAVTITVEPADGPGQAGGRKSGAEPKSELVGISPAGVAATLWSFAEDTVFDLLFADRRLWVATGLEGKVYTFAEGRLQLEKDVDDKQVVALLPGNPGPTFATTNAAGLYRVTAETETVGTYTSDPLDAGQLSRFGSFSWRGELPAGGSIRFSFRTGFSAVPDKTWSPWSDWREWREARDGRELPLGDLVPGKLVQWRVELKAGDRVSPRLFGAELSYRQENQAPKITGFSALDPGQILVPANFNPTNQVYEPAHPNREGIFTTLTSAAEDEAGGGRTKTLWKLGYQTLRWNGTDPNSDSLVYDVAFQTVGEDGGARAAGAGDSGEKWLPIADELKDEYLSFDSASLPDGLYRFRLRASDRPSNDPDRTLVAERLSDPVVVDHTPPELGKVEKEKDGRLRAAVRDAANPLREALYSVDAKEWQAAVVADGLLDGRSETLLLAVPAASTLILLRVTDAAHNVTTFDLSASR